MLRNLGRVLKPRRAQRRAPRRAPFRLESLEPRLMLHGDDDLGENPDHNLEDHIHASLSIYIDSQLVAIPTNLGVDQTGIISFVHTHEDDNRLHIHPVNGQLPPDFIRVRDVFDTWRTNAGLAGNNPDANFDENGVLGQQVDGNRVLRMWVNGQRTDKYEDYLINDGDQIVISLSSQPTVTFKTNQGPIVIELFQEDTFSGSGPPFERATPITVDNFLNYVNDGDYLNTVIHRSIPGFVVQGGGFDTSSEQFTTVQALNSQLTAIPTDPAILNEPGNDNVRGTIAMAKVSGNPDSATSQFFFNLDDNRGLPTSNPPGLDFQNGGFTAFGHVLDMSTVDAIADLGTVNAGGAFTSVPVDASQRLVVIEAVEGDGRVEGVEFADLDRDGVRDDGEPGLAGVTIFHDENGNGVLDDHETSTTTAADGSYQLVLPAGEHLIRGIVAAPLLRTTPIGAHSVNVQIGRTSSGFDFGSFEVLAPDGIDLLPASDTGASDSDDVTRFNNALPTAALQVRVTGLEPNVLVRVFADGVQIGQATANGQVDITTDGATALSGDVVLTATQTLGGVQGPPTAGLLLHVDSEPPIFTSTAPSDATVGETLLYDAQTNEEGSNGLIYGLDDEPAGVTIDADTGLMSWNPTPDQSGQHSFKITAVDLAGNQAVQVVDLDVQEHLVRFRLETTDLNEVAADTFTVGDEFLLNVFVQDISSDPEGVFAAFADILSDQGLVSVVGDLQFGDSFPNGRTGSTSGAVLIDEAGASASAELGGEPSLLFTARLRADGAGQETLRSDPADDLPDNHVLLLNQTDQIPSNLVRYGSTIVTIELPPQGGDDTSSGDASSISGFAYVDANNNGSKEAGERTLGGVTIALSGNDLLGASVEQETKTLGDGSYKFDDLSAGTYTVRQIQPAFMLDGRVTPGQLGGDASVSNQITLQLPEATDARNYNFGERGRLPQFIGLRDFFASTIQQQTLAIVDSSTNENVYSFGGEWTRFQSASFQVAPDRSRLDVTVLEHDDTPLQGSADIGDAQMVQELARTGSQQLFRLADRHLFPLQPLQAAGEGESDIALGATVESSQRSAPPLADRSQSSDASPPAVAVDLLLAETQHDSLLPWASLSLEDQQRGEDPFGEAVDLLLQSDNWFE